MDILQAAGRALCVYAALLIVVRILGKRTLGSITAFDLIVALMLGELAGEIIFGTVSLVLGLSSIGVIAAIHFVTSYLTSRFTWLDRMTGGSPAVLLKRGTIDRRALARERMNEEELLTLLRLKGVDDMADVESATLEPDGALSVRFAPDARPAQKRDLKR